MGLSVEDKQFIAENIGLLRSKKFREFLEKFPDTRLSTDLIHYLYCEKGINVFEGAQTIPIRAFYGNTDIKSFTLPSSITNVSVEAFSGCLSLKKVELNEGLERLGSEAFDSTAIENITLPSTMGHVFYSVFNNCSKLKTVNLNEGLYAISPRVFEDCVSLEKIEIPLSVHDIGEGVFDGCTALKECVIKSPTEPEGPLFNGCDNLTDVRIVKSSVLFKRKDMFNYIFKGSPVKYEDVIWI